MFKLNEKKIIIKRPGQTQTIYSRTKHILTTNCIYILYIGSEYYIYEKYRHERFECKICWKSLQKYTSSSTLNVKFR